MSEESGLDRPLEELSIEEIVVALQQGDVTVEDIRENEEVRQRINRRIVEMDMEEHSEVYKRLAEV